MFVTKILYVVEFINGRVKQFRALDGTLQNIVLNHTMNDFKIAAALPNCFFAPLISDSKDCFEIANGMKNKMNGRKDKKGIRKASKKKVNIKGKKWENERKGKGKELK